MPQSIVHFSAQSIDDNRQTVPRWRTSDALADKNETTKHSVYWVKPSAANAIERYSIHDSTTTHPPDYKVHTQYRGEWRGNVKHGYGTQIYGTNKKYEGEWQEDKRHGRGKLFLDAKTLATKATSPPASTSITARTATIQHTAQTAATIRKQRAQRQTPHLDLENTEWVEVYDGQWQDDRKCGSGRYEDPASGSVYEGEWLGGKKHGRGVMTQVNGDTYDGEWQADHQHGHGIEVHAESGDFYSGQWECGYKHGHGVYTYAKKHKVYEGEWTRGQAQTGSYMALSDWLSSNAAASIDLHRALLSSADSATNTQPSSEPIPRLRLAEPDKVILSSIQQIR